MSYEDVPVLVVGELSGLAQACWSVLSVHGFSAKLCELDSELLERQSSTVIVVADDAPTTVIDVVTAIRRRGLVQPVLVVTSNDLAPHISVHAFGAGADDCVYPYHPREVVARVELLLRRVHVSKSSELTRAERAILDCLQRHPGQWLSSGEIIREAMGTAHTSDTSLVRVHVHKIRKKLGPLSARIVSRRGLGYMWRSESSRPEADDEHSPTPSGTADLTSGWTAKASPALAEPLVAACY